MERGRFLAWLGPEYFDQVHWRQIRELVWELDLVDVRKTEEGSWADVRTSARDGP